MDRDALIKIYFSLGMSYQDILSTLALHGIIVSKRQLTRILRACGNILTWIMLLTLAGQLEVIKMRE